jgi:hypothetical protein
MSWRPRPPRALLTSEVGFTPSKWSVDNNASDAESDESVSEGFSGEGSSSEQEALARLRRLEQQLAAALTPSGVSVGATSSWANLKLPPFDPTSKFADPEGWCAIVDMWVNKHKPDAMELVMCLSSALKGEATSWLISAKPTEKDWPTLRAEFLAVFAKPVDSIEQFSEAVNGRRNVPGDTPLIDEMLHSMRTILSLLKNRESDEAFAVLVACYFGSTRDSVVHRRYQAEHPTDAKSMCTMLQGRLGKRAAFPVITPNRSIELCRRLPTSSTMKNVSTSLGNAIFVDELGTELGTVEIDTIRPQHLLQGTSKLMSTHLPVTPVANLDIFLQIVPQDQNGSKWRRGT